MGDEKQTFTTPDPARGKAFRDMVPLREYFQGYNFDGKYEVFIY